MGESQGMDHGGDGYYIIRPHSGVASGSYHCRGIWLSEYPLCECLDYPG